MSTASPQRLASDPLFRDGMEQRIVLDGISWESYERLLAEIDNRGVRLAYDQGRLELMLPSLLHERYKRLLGKIIEILAEELGIPYNGGGSVTFRQPSLRRGLEPDECFWLAEAASVTGKKEIDSSVDPPPDLVIEVDLTSSSLEKLATYASLRIPEVWRYDGQKLWIGKLQSGSVYAAATFSLSFPSAEASSLSDFLRKWSEMDEGEWSKTFRAWVRANLLDK